MHWKKITVEATADSLDVLETRLWNLGAVSVTVTDSEDNPIFEPGPGETPLWSRMDVSGLFEQDKDHDQLQQQEHFATLEEAVRATRLTQQDLACNMGHFLS